MVQNYRVALGFTSLPDSDDDEFCANVVLKMTGNAAFPASPVTMTALGALRLTFHDAIAAAMQGGVQLTSAKNDARQAMDDALRQVAAYVQSVAGKDLTALLSSGFPATSTNRSSLPLTTPNIVAIDNSAPQKFLVRLTPVNNAAAYQVRYVATSGTNPQPVTVESTSSRSILVPDLTSGMIYSLQVRAIGGATGYSEWSNPMTCMAT